MTTFDDFPGHKHKPNKEDYLMGVKVRTNNVGFRDEKDLIPKKDSIRIAFIGDSFLFGWGVRYPKTIPKLVENNLKNKLQCSKDIEVFNLGVGNYNTIQQLALYKDHDDILSSDLILLLHFINDAELYKKSKLNLIKKHSFLLNFIKSRIQTKIVGNYVEYYNSLYYDDDWNGNKNALIELNKISIDRTKNQLITFLLPELRELEKFSSMNEAYSLRESFFINNKFDYYKLRDLLTIHSKGNPSSLWVTQEDSHTNAKANELIAGFIVDKITKNIEKKCN